jgi:phytoene dehydrogenase-like protein
LAQEHSQQILRLWTEYAPNLDGAVLDWFARTPLDTERTLPNMQAGDLLVGSFANGQVGDNRPFAGAGRYRTPLEGLYLCGGSTHPGGNITGLCGYNAARVIAADLGSPIWWNPPDAETALASLT